MVDRMYAGCDAGLRCGGQRQFGDQGRMLGLAAGGRPVFAVLATLCVGALVFTLLGYDGVGAARTIFLTPLTSLFRWYDILVKAAPLAIIAIGLSIGFKANVWNIGGEGQYVLGGLAGTGIALLTLDMTGPWILPAMVVAGILGVFFVQLAHCLLPFALSFAAGAMLFVVFNEIIPEITS